MFAPAGRVARLLAQFEKEYLAKYTPCTNMSREQVIEAIAIVHVELILIHPFREGNGRLSRLLADVMAVQAGFQSLDYESWTQHPEQYIAAIHAGLNLNYEPMKYWVNEALKRKLNRQFQMSKFLTLCFHLFFKATRLLPCFNRRRGYYRASELGTSRLYICYFSILLLSTLNTIKYNRCSIVSIIIQTTNTKSSCILQTYF